MLVETVGALVALERRDGAADRRARCALAMGVILLL
jgi:hypothetical protein